MAIAASMRGLVGELQAAYEILALARAAFSGLTEITGLESVTLALHAPDGRPVLMVDNSTQRTDEQRQAYLEQGWSTDPLLTALLGDHVAQASATALLVPLLEPTSGLVGTLRCELAHPGTNIDERRIAAVAMVVVGRLLQLGVTSATLASEHLLTPRQRDTADLALRGMTTDQIAAELAISRNTVKKHLHEVFGRLAVSNRVQLARAFQITQATSDVPFGVTHSGDVVVTRRPIDPDQAPWKAKRNGARGTAPSLPAINDAG